MSANDADIATIVQIPCESSASTNTDYQDIFQRATAKHMVSIGNIAMILLQKQLETNMKSWILLDQHENLDLINQQFTISATRRWLPTSVNH